MKFEVKMMPGQEPYTEAELQKLYGMIGAACEAEECFEDYELEDHAQAQAKTHPSKSKSLMLGQYAKGWRPNRESVTGKVTWIGIRWARVWVPAFGYDVVVYRAGLTKVPSYNQQTF